MTIEWGRSVLLGGLVLLSGCHDASANASLSETELVEVVAVGVLDGDEREVFGRIVDVRGTDDGGFLVLDQQAASVGWFGLSGDYLGGVRTRGAGPGELSEPVSLTASSTGVVIVLDPPNGRFSTFELGPEGMRHAGSFSTLPTSRGSMCSIEDRFFLRTVREGERIHEFDQGGGLRRSFEPTHEVSDEAFGPAAPMVASQMNAGHLHCLQEPGVVLSMDTYLPHVRAYTPEGELLWDVELPDLRPMRFTPTAGGGGVVFETDPAGSHLGESVVRWTDDSILVQHSLTWPEGTPVSARDRDFHAIESREISLETGQELGRTDSLPLIVDEQDGRFYSFENLPYPRARVLRRPG